MVAGLVGVGLVVDRWRRPTQTTGAGAAGAPAAVSPVAATLLAIAATLDPGERRRAARSLEIADADLSDALGAVIATPGHPQRLEALELAAQRQLEGLVDVVRAGAAAGSETERAACIRVAERLSPWPEPALEQLLQSDARSVILASLHLLSQRTGSTAEPLLPLVAHADPVIRAAAREAAPTTLAPSDIEALVARASAAPDAGQQVAALLAGAGPSATVVPALDRLAQSHEAATRLAALAALADRQAVTDTVQHAATDPMRSPDERAAALRGLERGAQVEDLARLESSVVDAPLVRYQTARCGLRAGRRDGVSLLVELAEAQPSGEGEAVTAQARATLAHVTGVAAGSDRDSYDRWLAQRPVLPARPLPDPAASLPAAAAHR